MILVVIIGAVIWAFIPNPFYNEVQALLDDTGATYEIHDCSGGWVAREMHSEITISRSELEKLIEKWELAAPLPHFKGYGCDNPMVVSVVTPSGQRRTCEF